MGQKSNITYGHKRHEGNSGPICSKSPKVHDRYTSDPYLPRSLAPIREDTITGRYYRPVLNFCICILHEHLLRCTALEVLLRDNNSHRPMVIGNYVPQKQFPDNMKFKYLTPTKKFL